MGAKKSPKLSAAKSAVKSVSRDVEHSRSSALTHLELGALLLEKGELSRSKAEFLEALYIAKRHEDQNGIAEALLGLHTLAVEAGEGRDPDLNWSKDVKRLIERNRNHSALAYLCLAQQSRYLGDYAESIEWILQGLAEVRRTESVGVHRRTWARLWLNLIAILVATGNVLRAEAILNALQRKVVGEGHRGVDGMIYLLRAQIGDRKRDFEGAWKWVKEAHRAVLLEHDWYRHSYVLYWYARISRKLGNFSQAYWYLDLLGRMSFPAGSEVASLVRREREELEGDAIDLIVDSRHHLVRTREGGVVDLKKQFVLLKILESLAQAHNREGGDEVRGLSKAELVEKVWNEKYTPALHDNKLYYNINRVRKLIEPEVRRPQYLQNWREGYRLAPDLRVERVSDQGLVEELKQQISH